MITGGPAFPRTEGSDGMFLRDFFAAAALTAIITDPFFRGQAENMGYGEFAEELAEEAYAVADAMLEEREKRK
jgi:hypothetical protein